MKKIFVLSILLISITSFTFAEFQFEPSIGYCFNTDTYDSYYKRTFDGLNTNITMRYLFTQNIGLFFGGNFCSFFSADNSDYAKAFESEGMKAVVNNDSAGYKLDLNFGLALAFPVNEKFIIQSDIGLSNTVLGIDFISGKLKWEDYYYKYEADFLYSVDKISSMGIYAVLNGCYEVFRENTSISYITFGLRLDYKFNRTESGETIILRTSTKFSETYDKFSGFAITPFIGYLSRFGV